MYTVAELEKGAAFNAENILQAVTHYLRFTGLWTLSIIFLIMAQIRSARWAKAILKRLEVI